ncbi:unnamed protein product, partial [Didymodactylos carnosus]
GEEYDDEYDDTYADGLVEVDDTIESELNLMKNENKEKGIMPNRFRANNNESEDEDDESKPRRDQFVENPEVVRERFLQRQMQWQQRHQRPAQQTQQPEQYDVTGTARGRGQSSTVVHNRRWKNQTKSTHGNHNRRDLASRKMAHLRMSTSSPIDNDGQQVHYLNLCWWWPWWLKTKRFEKLKQFNCGNRKYSTTKSQKDDRVLLNYIEKSTRRKKRSESMEVQTAADEEDDNNSKDNADGSRPKTRRAERSNLASLASPVSESYQRSQAVHVANLLHEAGLTDVLHSDWSEQIKYFLSERSYLIHQIEIIRSQYGIIKKRLDESETENEKLLTENRILSKEVLLYRNLINAPPSADGNSKDYTQLRSKIDQVLLENARLYQEINAFKTSDPVYEQVQILEEQKKQLEKDFNRLKAQLKLNESSVITSISDTTNVSPKRNKIDEQQRQQITRLQTENHTLNSKLNSATDECEQLRLLNKKLISDIEQLRQVRSPTILSATKNTNYLSTIIDSSTTTTNRDHKAKSKSRAHRYTTEIVPLTQSNLKYFDSSSRKSLTSPISQRTTPDHEIVELREHVRRLENTLHQREIELGKLQQEIEKGTSSIMSSIEDLFLISTPPPSTQQSPSKGSTSHDKELVLPLPRSTVVNTLSSSLVVSTTDEIERLQTELDQLHDKLDDISRENQLLRDRVQDCETVEEENVFLYAKKQKLDDEIERGRMRELLIEQELKLLQDKLKGAEGNRDNKGGQSTIMDTSQTIGNISNMKLKIDRLHRVNNQLELEVIGLRDELQLTNNKYEQCKRELYQKDEHYKKLLAIIEDNQRFPQELPRLEKLNVELENQLENQKKEYDIKIHDLQERNEKREQKYSSLYESILKLQSDYRQKEIDYVNTMDDVIRQREELRLQINQLKQQYEQLQHEYQILKGELESKEEINRDLKLALTSSTNDTQSIYTQLRHLNTSLSDLQIKYNRDMKDRNDQIDQWKIENKNLMTTHEIELVQARQTIAQLQQNNIQIDNLRSTIDKLQLEIAEKQG